MRTLARLAALPLVLLALAPAGAQVYRNNQPEVLTPVPMPVVAPPPDHAALFLKAYQAAGRPRMALLWNREFSDTTQSATADTVVVRESGSAQFGLQQARGRGSARQDGDASFDRTLNITSARNVDAGTARASLLPESQSAALRRAFVAEVGRAGVLFVDRATAMRLAAAQQHRGGGDPRLIETDALLRYADVLVEVLMVPDRDGPGGFGFDVRAKSLKTGAEIASAYSLALQPEASPRRGTWVAGRDGFELRMPPPAPLPNAAQVGTALGRDVLQALEAGLPAVGR